MERIAFYMIYILPVLQILLYLHTDTKKVRYGKLYVFLAILVTYFCIPFVVDYFSPNKNGCLLPVISMFCGIWIIGICFTCITHLLYMAFKKIKFAYNKTQKKNPK